MTNISRFLLALLVAASLFDSAVVAADQFELPTSEDGLPGEGALRRYEGYVKRWPQLRAAWAKRAEQDEGAVVFLGDSITQGWGANFRDKFFGMKLANRGNHSAS
jgi:hypothetical protein